jgi:LysM repeat protein
MYQLGTLCRLDRLFLLARRDAVKRFISILGLLILGLGLVGCDLSRGDQAAGDISPPVTPASPPLNPAGAAITQNGEAVVRFEPSAPQMEPGATQAIEIRIDNVADLTAADVQLQFDPAVLQVQDADPGKEGFQIQPGNFPAPDFVVSNVATNTTGLVQYAVVQVPPSQPVNGNGVLAVITFQAIAQGTSNLLFVRTELANSQAQPIPVVSQSGQIVVGGPGPIITLTPTNTAQPGTPTATFTPTVTPPPTNTTVPATVTPSPTLPPTPLPTATSVPLPPQVQIPPGATVGFCYRVQFGDTLYSLAQTYGTDPEFISLVNDLYPPGHIYPQKVLFMPTAYGNGPNVYLVKGGDTLAGIADQCKLKLDLLAYVNGLPENANLAQIEILIIPRPPYAPPARYPYPQVGPPSVWPPPCSGNCY